MRVLIGCESSGIIRDAFLARGHDAISCDLLPTSRPGPHYQGDVRDIWGNGFDLMIVHPDCTYVCGSGLHWNNRGRGWERTEAALDFDRECLAAPVEKIALENPVGLIGTRIRKADQWIQPYEFGHDASKKTGLWLKNLPLLLPTEYVKPRLVCKQCKGVSTYDVAFGKGCPHCGGEAGMLAPRCANQTDSGQNKLAPSANRWQLRAETYPGWGDAMAEQWGGQ